MSSLYHTQARTDLKHRDYGFILGLVCMALAVAVACVIFTPAAIGSGITSEIYVGRSLKRLAARREPSSF